jgi:hypothetical protein
VGGQRHAPAASTPGKDPVPIAQEAGWAPGPVYAGGKSRPLYNEQVNTIDVAINTTEIHLWSPVN